MSVWPASWRSLARLGAPALAFVLTAGTLRGEDAAWRVTRGDVRVVCPMTVGGSFEARTPSLTGGLALKSAHPPAFDGDLAVDLKTLDTGIGLRDRHLREEYLEVGKGEGFERAVLSNIRLGDVDPATYVGRTAFAAEFALHGSRRAIEGQAEIRRDGASVRVEAAFKVALADYGIAKPQYLGVGVRDEVQVKVSLVATPAAASPAASK